MTALVKQKVKKIITSSYGKEMIKIYGLKYIKKEIFHAIKNQNGDKRKIENLI